VAEFDSAIPAGSSGKLVARLKTAMGQSGRISKLIAVTTDAPGAAEFRLRFSADVRMPVTVSPAYRFSLSLIEGRSGAARLTLARGDGRPLEILGASSGREGLDLVVESAVAAGEGGPAASRGTPTPWGQVDVAPPAAPTPEAIPIELRASSSLPAGTFSGTVRITTDHPEAPTLEIPYTLRVRPLIEALPASVRMWANASTGDPGRSTFLRLRHNGGRAFAIRAVEVSHPQHIVATAMPREESSEQTVRVTLQEGLDATALGAGVRGWVRIGTSDDDRPMVEVPVLISPARVLGSRPVRGGG
jgi:hypothetical protein